MKKNNKAKFFLFVLIIIFFITCNLFSQVIPQAAREDKDTNETQSAIKRDYVAEYWLFGSIPVIVAGWGIGAWGWGTASGWQFKNDGWGLEQDSYTGGADKVSHAWAMHTISRIGSYVFERSGDTKNKAAFKGFLFSQFMGLGIEIGDGFGETYGFSRGDMIWNLGGGVIALAFDLFPAIDDLIGFQIEYWPSGDYRNQKPGKWIEFTSDVSGQKFLFALKLSGVPYMQNTFLRYFQMDFGYYTRGYWYPHSSYKYKTRHAYMGFAFNLSRVSESLLPEGSWSNSFSKFFKYYHPPVAYNPDALDHTLKN